MDILISMHGAALSNVLFMPQAAGFVELDHVRNAQSVLSTNQAEQSNYPHLLRLVALARDRLRRSC